MIQLIGGANSEGYSHALMKVWSGKMGIEHMPARSALCRTRQRISYLFFKDIFERLIQKAEPLRLTWQGLRIYAIDGQMLTLPRSKEIRAAGFTGRSIGKFHESYMPKGFLTHAYDVLSGVSKDFRFTNRLHEQEDAQEMLADFEKNSLTLYDRLYFGERLVRAHCQAKNYFLFRCRSNACKEILDFFNDPDKTKTRTFKFRKKYQIHLVRIYNKTSKKDDIFATNLPLELVTEKQIKKLYRLRWEVETSFQELTGITKAEQWHSKSVNGIYQEIYARFWLINFTKLQTLVRTQSPKNPLKDVYKKANFKLLYNFILMVFPKILKQNPRVMLDFERLRKRSLERRKHHSRHYKREVKSPASPYPHNNTQWFFDA